MSIDAYKIAVQISLVENVTRGLATLSRYFKAADTDAKALEARIAKIGKMAAAGSILAGAGAAGLKMFEAPLDKAMEYERFLARMRQMGLGDSQIKDAEKFVEATKIINTSVLDRMRIFSEAQGAFRQSGMSGDKALEAAKTMTPVLATYEVAMQTLSGPTHAAAEHAMRNLNKTVEMMGGLGDTKRAQEIADGVFKTVQSSGKMVDERQLKQFFAYGSSATNQQDLRTVFGGLEPIIGELGGSTTAVGLRTAYTRTNGMMALMPRRLKEEMQRLGMTDETGKQQTTDLARLQATNIIGYTEEIMRRYQSAGITSQTDRERENAIIFGTNGAKVFNKIMSQMAVLHESLEAYDKSKGASDVANDPANQRLMAQQNLAKKIEDFQLALARNGGLLDLATKGLTMLANGVERLTKFANDHPTITKLAVATGLALSGLMLLGGGVLLLKSALSALSLIGISGIASSIAGAGSATLVGALGALVSPIGLVVAVLGTLAAAAYAFRPISPTEIEAAKHEGGARLTPTAQSRVDAGELGAPSQYVKPADQKPIVLKGDVNMDGRKVGTVMWNQLGTELGRPQTGPGTFDPAASLRPSAL
ncbi:hypothetical protein DEE91_01095 [Ralstonia pickettii]|jgi:hypothetical protein|nr:hypothetical protein AC240_06960 [Ralstonia sp. MD27]MBA9854491.1 hypothetical protein [Ralstonia insidiosa]MBX3770334.1 hypothetical protein [Ralstonia pickettii]NOZ14858.1 hypothetical protein [Betaproteobacteria bacterium]MBA9868306.1 hypothetical protein [Ralstonia insidiosa]